MAIMNNLNVSFLDWANRLDPDGKIAKIMEILNMFNGIIEDFSAVEGNLPTGHRTTVRTGLPLPTWRRLYAGVQPSKSTVAQVTDACGMLEAYSEIDKALADLNSNLDEFLLSESMPFLEAMAQEVSRAFFFGDETVLPGAFTGLGPRYSTKTIATAQSAFNVVDFLGQSGGSGTASNYVSAWLVAWGAQTVCGIFPKGSKAGLQSDFKGQVTVENADMTTMGSGRMEAYRTHFRWDVGLSVRDWRYAARVGNIDVTSAAGGLQGSTVSTYSAPTAALVKSMIIAAERIPNLQRGNMVWYVPRQVRESLRLGILNQIAYQLNWETVAGERVMLFDGIPVKRTDVLNITNEAAQVSATITAGKIS